jgi:hypothetical protein
MLQKQLKQTSSTIALRRQLRLFVRLLVCGARSQSPDNDNKASNKLFLQETIGYDKGLVNDLR